MSDNQNELAALNTVEVPQLAQSGSMADGYELPDQNNSLLGFLKKHHYKGESLLVSDKVAGVDALHAALTKASAYLRDVAPETPHAEFDAVLADLGLDKGWGGTAKRALDTIRLFLDILEAPSNPDPAAALAKFFSAAPIVFNTVILCPHDYFAPKHGVTGNHPDTASTGYILEQVRAIKEEMVLKYKEQGLDDAVPDILIVVPSPPCAVDAGSALVLELVIGNTLHTNIIRFPLSTEKGGILGQGIFRFDVWPYLDDYTEEVLKCVLEELEDAWPDMSVNNYNSDGILAARLVVHRQNVTQGNIGHAKQVEGYYHFPCRISSYSLTQPRSVYSTIGGNGTYPNQLDGTGSAATARPSEVWAVQAPKDSLPTHVVPGRNGWLNGSPTNGRIWRGVGTPAVLSLLGFIASTLVLVGVDGELVEMSILFAMAQVGFLAMFNKLRNHKN